MIQNRTKSEPIKSIKFEDKILTDNKEIAEVFSNYYKYAAFKKVNEIKSEVNFEHFLNEKDKRVNTFHLKEIDLNEVLDVIKDIKPKSSSGFDSIPNKLVCKAAPSLIAPLKFIINKSFSNGKFPDLLKTSKINPIHKKLTYEPQNFRPICMQSVFSKIIEKAAYRQISDYNKDQFTDNYQFAYKEGHSSVHATLLARHEIRKRLDQRH